MKAKRKADGSVKITMSEQEAEIMRAITTGVWAMGELDQVSSAMLDTFAGFSYALSKADTPLKWKYRRRITAAQIMPVYDGKSV